MSKYSVEFHPAAKKELGKLNIQIKVTLDEIKKELNLS